MLRVCQNLKFIDIAFTGVDHVGLEAAKERGIAVRNASGYSNEPVSELVLGIVNADGFHDNNFHNAAPH